MLEATPGRRSVCAGGVLAPACLITGVRRRYELLDQMHLGKLNHKNLFAGAKVYVVVEDEVLNRIESGGRYEDAVNTVVRSGDILVRCTCGRIAIEDKEMGQITIYDPEQH